MVIMNDKKLSESEQLDNSSIQEQQLKSKILDLKSIRKKANVAILESTFSSGGSTLYKLEKDGK